MTDQKVVIGGDQLNFSENPNPSSTSHPPEEKKQPQLVIPDVQELLKRLLESTSILAGKHSAKYRIDISRISPYLPWVRFDHHLCPFIEDVPKSNILTIVKGTNPYLSYLLEHTDLGQELPDYFNPGAQESYRVLPQPLGSELEEAVHRKEVHLVNEFSKQFLQIPDYGVLSLFIKNGEDLLEYMRTANILDSAFDLKIGRGVKTDGYSDECKITSSQIFNSQSLHEFVEQTKKTRLVDMLTDVQTCIEQIGDTMYDRPGQVRQLLYDRLQQHHPELIK